MRFKRHYNRALGKEIFTAREYVSEMKKQGVAPADSAEAQPRKYPKRQYRPSAWAHEIVREIKRRTDKDGTVHLGGSARAQIESNLKAVPPDIRNKLKGGWNNG